MNEFFFVWLWKIKGKVFIKFSFCLYPGMKYGESS